MVLLTSDRRLRDRCRQEFEDVFVASGTGDLLERLNEFEPAADDLALRAAETLIEYLNENIGDRGEALPFDDLGFEFQSGAEIFGFDTLTTKTSMELRQVDLVEVYAFRTARNEQGRFGLAELRIFGDVYLAMVEQREVANGSYEWARELVGPFSQAYVDVTVAISWNQNWQLEDVSPTGVAVVVVSSPEDDDEDDVEHATTFRATATDSKDSP